MSNTKFIAPYVEAGFAIHWLRKQSKAPVESSWSTVPVKTVQQLTDTYVDGYNVGVRLGKWSKVDGKYLHVIDMDIRKDTLLADAIGCLETLFPNYKRLPFVISGSGGESRHFYFLCDEPFGSKKLARSQGFEMVFDPSKNRPVKKHDWEIELFGTGKQVAMPPSIHPDTGLAYRWGGVSPLDMRLIEGLPVITSEHISAFEGVSGGSAEGDDERPTLNLTLEQAQGYIDSLPLDEWCIDRDGWFQVGMALHHEFEGRSLGGEAFEMWCKFSAQSDKFDLNDAARVWKSFKDNKTRNIRMATIVQVARNARFQERFGEVVDGQDGFDEPTAPASIDDLLGSPAKAPTSIDDLLGTAPPTKTVDPLDDLDDLVAKVKPSEPASAWMSKLEYNDEGAVRPTLPNVKLIVVNDVRLKGVVGYNEFTEGLVRVGSPGRLVKRRESPQGTTQLEGDIWGRHDLVNGDLWRDVHDNLVRDMIESPGRQGGYGIKVSDRDLGAAINIAANNNTFHPVRNYLDGLKWDGVSRVETLFIRYFGSPDNPYSRGVARNMMTGGVTRIYEPGHKFDFAVILEGMQGKRKTTFIETLACHWFGELASEFDNTNKMIESMQNAWIIEIPELSGFSKSDVQSIKAFISRRTDRARLAWAKHAQDYRRQCIFIGSTNDAKYLRDDTGGRRFWPVECLLPDDAEIDIESLRDEVDQLWAEALHLYRDMRAKQPKGALPLYLADAEAKEEAERLQESRRIETVEDIMAGQIEAWLDTPVSPGDGFDDAEKVQRNATCLKSIWIDCLGYDERAFNNQVAATVGRAFRKIKGWDIGGEKLPTPKYGRQKTFFRMSEAIALKAKAKPMIF